MSNKGHNGKCKILWHKERNEWVHDNKVKYVRITQNAPELVVLHVVWEADYYSFSVVFKSCLLKWDVSPNAE